MENIHPWAYYWGEKIDCVHFNPFAEDVFMSWGHSLKPAESISLFLIKYLEQYRNV